MHVPSPLEALLRVRREIKQQRERLLAAATAECVRAEEVLSGAAQREAAQRVDLTECLEAQASGDPSRVADRQTRERYAARQRRELEARERQREQAAAALAERRAERESARRLLLDAETALQVVERRAAAWDQARRAEEQRRAELELEDLIASRQRGGTLP
jgi:membrane protein involved in colicin uptake